MNSEHQKVDIYKCPRYLNKYLRYLNKYIRYLNMCLVKPQFRYLTMNSMFINSPDI